MQVMPKVEIDFLIHAATLDASERGHSTVSVEHLLLQLIKKQCVDELLKFSTNSRTLKGMIVKYLDGKPISSRTLRGQQLRLAPEVQRAIQRANMHIRTTGDGLQPVSSLGVLIALLPEKETYGVELLGKMGLNREACINFQNGQPINAGVTVKVPKKISISLTRFGLDKAQLPRPAFA